MPSWIQPPSATLSSQVRIFAPSLELGWPHLQLTPERFYYDPGEPIRFRVDDIEWNEHEPGPPVNRAQQPAEEEEKDPMEKAGYRIIASVAEQGLGLTNWWDESAEEEGEEGEYDEGAYEEA